MKMPVYNSRDLIPFVNELEQKVLAMMESVDQWDKEKYRLIPLSERVTAIDQNAISALIRADEAMTEIGTATFRSTAQRGKRLEDTLKQLKNDIYKIAEEVATNGGGGELTEGVFYDELNNAIANVDVTIKDGLKLDYRLREITSMAQKGIDVSAKDLYMPYKYHVEESTDEFIVPQEEGVIFVEADVTVLDKNGDPFLDLYGNIITGKIQPSGKVDLTYSPREAFTVYFPVKMKLKDIPDDFLYLFANQMIQKNSRIMEVVLNFEDELESLIEDVQYMKGVHWTPDISIMTNYQNIIKEGITPKGLHTEVKDGMAHVTFSYNDHPELSHFVLEKWDEEQKKFVPYDGKKGIIQK